MQDLYDDLIRKLEDLLNNEAFTSLDSIRAIKDLERMLATLRKSRDGTILDEGNDLASYDHLACLAVAFGEDYGKIAPFI